MAIKEQYKNLSVVIKDLKKLFFQFDIPNWIILDNLQFNPYAFKVCCSANDIKSSIFLLLSLNNFEIKSVQNVFLWFVLYSF